MSLTAAVGKNAANRADDVLIVQALLNLNIDKLSPLPPLVQDCGFGRFTQAYITEFQTRCVPSEKGTDTVRPGSETLAALLRAKPGSLTIHLLEVLMPLTRPENAARYFEPLKACMANNEINTPLRQAHFLAQLGHESGSFRFPEEIADGSQYEGRADLGNSQPGDGKRFKGRGLIQITGRANYIAYGKARNRDFITGDNPRLLATDPTLAADCSGWYWTSRGLNPIADQDDVRRVTLKINGGFNGLDDRMRRLRLAKCLLL